MMRNLALTGLAIFGAAAAAWLLWQTDGVAMLPLLAGCGVQPCCCGCPNIFSDNFTRADSTDLGSDWTEASGAWEIASNALKATSNGVAVYATTIVPTRYKVKATCTSTTDGDVTGVIAFYGDTSNYYSAEITHHDTASSCRLKIWKNVAGARTELATITPSNALASGTAHILNLCVSDASSGVRLSAWVEVPGGGVDWVAISVTDTSHAGPGKAGVIRQSASGTTTFDDFSIVPSKDANADCPVCLGNCGGCVNDVGPAEWLVTIAGYGDIGGKCVGCSTLDGEYYLPLESNPVGSACCSYLVNHPDPDFCTTDIPLFKGYGDLRITLCETQIVVVFREVTSLFAIDGWRKLFGSDPDCNTSHTLTLYTASGACSEPATVTMEPV